MRRPRPRPRRTPAACPPDTPGRRPPARAASAASASARGDTHARAAASAGVDTAHSGCARPSAAINSGSPSAYPIRSPASPQVLVRLRSTTSPGTSRAPASASRSPGTASMNASSTTRVRPGRAKPATSAAGWRTDVGLVGLPTTTRSASSRHRPRVQPEAVRRVEQHPLHRVPGVAQRRLRLGELRVHHHRAARPQGAGEQDERLRRARGQQHLAVRPAVPGGHRVPGRPPVRIGREPGQGRGDPLRQP